MDLRRCKAARAKGQGWLERVVTEMGMGNRERLVKKRALGPRGSKDLGRNVRSRVFILIICFFRYYIRAEAGAQWCVL